MCGEDDGHDPILYCPTCNAPPYFQEVWDNAFECQHCGTIIDRDGNIIKEGEEPSPETEEDEEE